MNGLGMSGLQQICLELRVVGFWGGGVLGVVYKINY